MSGKGDILLRAVPAIRAIIERGTVAHREPGKARGIVERIVVTAPVEVAGTVHRLGVSIHQDEGGHFHYDLTFDRDAGKRGAGGPGSGARSAIGVSANDSREGTASDLNLFEWPAQFKSARASTTAVLAALKASPLGTLIDPLIDAGRLVIHDDVVDEVPPGTTAWADPDGTMHLIAEPAALHPSARRRGPIPTAPCT